VGDGKSVKVADRVGDGRCVYVGVPLGRSVDVGDGMSV